MVNDVAVIKVLDKNPKVFGQNKIHPACLPRGTTKFGEQAIHSGWSTPPPKEYLEVYVKPYLERLKDFAKQWHYNMEVTESKDPKLNLFNGTNLTYPSNTFYPPGVVCATEFTKLFCPTSGESGSTLMVKQDEKFSAEGILSFIKGCSTFEFASTDVLFGLDPVFGTIQLESGIFHLAHENQLGNLARLC